MKDEERDALIRKITKLEMTVAAQEAAFGFPITAKIAGKTPDEFLEYVRLLEDQIKTGKNLQGFSEECSKIISENECFVIYGASVSEVRDEFDGEVLFRCSTQISPYDLASIFKYGEEKYSSGMEDGVESLAGRMRVLLGIKP